MNETQFEEPGSLERPGPIGRIVRIVAGILCVYFLFLVVKGQAGMMGADVPTDARVWIGAVLCLYGLPHIFNIGYGRNWGGWPRWVTLLLALGAVAFSTFQHDSLWGPEPGLIVFVLLGFVLINLGPSFVLSGILATPG